MDDSVKQIVRDAIVKIIRDTASERNIGRSLRLHEAKIHFVPTKYRVLGGLLQSLNIKFGNFIEKLIALVVERDAKDVDALFKSWAGQIVYLEIKYNDDHDTGKFVDINRKFIKTYAGLVNLLGITDAAQLKPVLYYFNPVKRWGANLYAVFKHIPRFTAI